MVREQAETDGPDFGPDTGDPAERETQYVVEHSLGSRCDFYIGDPSRDTQRRCSRPGTRAVLVEGREPEGPFCWQHARIIGRREVARVMSTKIVRVAIITEERGS